MGRLRQVHRLSGRGGADKGQHSLEGNIVILIIGGMGFIGLNTALRLLEVGENVVITQHTSHRMPDLPQRRAWQTPLHRTDGCHQPL